MESCYGGGSIVAAVIGTFLSTIVALALAGFVWKRRKAKQNPLRDLVLVESGQGKTGGYENLGFKDEQQENDHEALQSGGEPKKETILEPILPPQREKRKDTFDENRKSSWTHFGFLLGHSKDKTESGGILASQNPEYTVNLKGHDFTGLGFSIDGGGPGGILIKEVMQRGPAAESGKMVAGDRIRSMSMCLDGVVLSDAVALMAYASPYGIRLHITKPIKDIEPVQQLTVTEESEVEKCAKLKPPRDYAVQIEMESVQMKSPDILDLRPSTQKLEDRKSEMPIARIPSPEYSTGRRSASPRIICADIPDTLVYHMEKVTSKEDSQSGEKFLCENDTQEISPEISTTNKNIQPILQPPPEPSQQQSAEDKEDQGKVDSITKSASITLELAKIPQIEVDLPKSDPVRDDQAQCHSAIKYDPVEKDSRPPSADSTGRSKFHIRLFHKSKQYNVEPDSGSSTNHANIKDEEDLHLKLRKMNESEIEGSVSMDSRMESPGPDSPPGLPVVTPSDKQVEQSIISKGLKSLKDLKEKVSQKLSIHESCPSDSDSESPLSPIERKNKKGKKNDKKDKNAISLQVTSQNGNDSSEHVVTNEIEAGHNSQNELVTNHNEDSSENEESSDRIPKKPKRSTKRKAPIPPSSQTSTLDQFHPNPSNPPMGESKRCASYGHIPTPPVHDEGRMERASSLDLSPSTEGHISSIRGMTDLTDSRLQFPPPASPPDSSSTSSTSSSSETLREMSSKSDDSEKVLEKLTTDEIPIISEKPQALYAETYNLGGIDEEVAKVAQEMVHEVLKSAEEKVELIRSLEVKRSRIPIPIQTTNGSLAEGECKEVKGKGNLLRDDSKKRLMQTVADANDIKLSSTKLGSELPGRSTEVTSSSSSSSSMLDELGKGIELSSKELDEGMMSHAEFLARQECQSQPDVVTEPNDTSFDTWIFVDKKLQGHTVGQSEEHPPIAIQKLDMNLST